jgi:ethanolamine permease
MGVAIAVSGNFSGWNYGLAVGGWGGMFAAAILMAVLYLGLTQIVGELASSYPEQSGFDQYVTQAFGHLWGRSAGITLSAGLAIGTGLAASFISAYADSVGGLGGWPLKVVLLILVALLQARGARDSVRATFIAGAVALLVLLGFCLVLAPRFALSKLFTSLPGLPRTVLPAGLAGIFACVPFALFFFVGVEQAALAAAEAEEPARTIPRALTVGVITALVIGFSVLIVASGVGGVDRLARVDDPLYAAAIAAGGGMAQQAWVARLIGLGAIVSLLATFFSLSYAASRQVYALALTAGLPQLLSRTNRRHAPHWAIALVTVIGAVAAAFDPNTVMVLFVFLLNVAYQMVIAAYILLRGRRRELRGGFRAFGGTATGLITAVLSLVVLVACVQQQPVVTSAAFAGLLIYLTIARLVSGRAAAAV